MNAATFSVIGTVVTPTGLVQHSDGSRIVDVCWTPAAAYKREQPAHVPVHLAHDLTWPIGRAVHLERDNAHGLTAVCTIDVDLDLDDGRPWYFSDGITSRRIGDSLRRYGVELIEVSLVSETANVANRPVWLTRGDISRGAAAPRGVPLWMRDTWARAAAASETARYRSAAPLTIVDLDERDAYDEAIADPDGFRRAVRAHRQAADERRRTEAAVADLGASSRTYRHRVGGRVIDPAAVS